MLFVDDIITVTQGGILYRNEADQVDWIDFRECNANWQDVRQPHHPTDSRCVGWRNTRDGAILDVEFLTMPPTRFVFRSYYQRDRLLLEPMKRLGGWFVWDAFSHDGETNAPTTKPVQRR